MASSESMDDSFRVRVEKVFGSLAPAKSSALQSSPWSLTDDEIERREWRRGTDTSDRDDTPCSSSFDEFCKKDEKASWRKLRRARQEDLDDLDDGDEQADRSFGGNEGDRDAWEIRSSIGLDPTLDREEEEDEYDKVAIGRENAGDRLFMSDVTDHGSYLNSHNVLSNPSHGTAKDLRANRLAARIRLKEDEVEAQNYTFGHVNNAEVKGQRVEASKDCNQPRPILKRKDNIAVSRSEKHVRFDPSCRYGSEEAIEKYEGAPLMEATVSDDGSQMVQNASRVPDYLLNPSKYTYYSFDSTSEIDEESNAQACMDSLNLVKELKPPDSGLEASKDCNQPRPILKRKDNSAVSRSQKRVRFDPSCRYGSEEAIEMSEGAPLMEAAVSDDGSQMVQNASRVPDYLLNPSKYTYYSFDSTSEIDEESNAQACMDSLNLVKELKPPDSGLEPADSSADLPKSVIFIPKRKASDAEAVSDSAVLKQNKEEDHKQSLHGTDFFSGIAAGEAQYEVSAMEEDETETNAADRSAGFQRPGRKYRTKSRSDDHDS